MIVDLTRQRARLDELLLRVLAAGDRNDVALTTAATSTAAWVAHATVRPAGAAHADVTLAVALDEDFAATHAALAAGRLGAERARVIVRAVQALPTDGVEREPALARRAEEREAARATYLEIHDNGDGTTTGRFKVPALQGAMLRRALDSLITPATRALGALGPSV